VGASVALALTLSWLRSGCCCWPPSAASTCCFLVRLAPPRASWCDFAAFRFLCLAKLTPPHAQGRRLSKLCSGYFFERLLTRFSVPEELFGPLSLRALEQDMYVRQIKGYLPDASVAFIDEVRGRRPQRLPCASVLTQQRRCSRRTARS
jgi:hypothetical protein